MTDAPMHFHDSLGSTQDEAHRLAAVGARHGTAVVARVQTAGRGTRGREWVSGLGGLWLSVVCRPVTVSGIETLSLRTGLVLAELLEQLVAPGVAVAMKWPNDLMIGDAKVGGILAEARWLGETLSWVVVGVGINLRNTLPSGLRIPGTSLVQHGATLTSEALARRVVEAITRAAGAVPPLAQGEIAAFRTRDWLFGRQLTLPHPGIASGITDAGRLLVMTGEGGLVVSGGPVELDPGP